MELKVWVEGIQRIVCGVTDSTTCQDVVFALAHATGKVGRFTLIERWRNNERLLAPHEYPLKILMKWGEYSNDVQFILQRSDSTQKLNVQSGSPPNSNNVKIPPGNSVRSSSSQSGNSNDTNSQSQDRFKDPRRNFAISTTTPHPTDGTLSPSKEVTGSPLHTQNNHLVGIVRGIPQNKVPGNVKQVQPNLRKDVPPYREPPPPYRSPPPPTTSPSTGKPNSHSQAFPKPGALSQPSQPSQHSVQIADAGNKFEHANNNVANSEAVVYNQQYKELVSLVNYQRDKLTSQQADLTKFDAEIGYWETKGREQERQAELIQQQITSTDTQLRISTEQAQALTYIEDESEIVKQAEKTLKSEMTLLRSKLANCETELLQCKNKIRKLLEDIHVEQRTSSRAQENRQQMERSLLAEVERLQNDIQQAKHATEMNHMTAETLKREVGQLETTIMEKKRQVEQLVNEMKEANLQSLAGSTDEIRYLLEGSGKPGSTRRIIGSPRQLENAVPTNKNPHGVWV